MTKITILIKRVEDKFEEILEKLQKVEQNTKEVKKKKGKKKVRTLRRSDIQLSGILGRENRENGEGKILGN